MCSVNLIITSLISPYPPTTPVACSSRQFEGVDSLAKTSVEFRHTFSPLYIEQGLPCCGYDLISGCILGVLMHESCCRYYSSLQQQ